VIIRELQVERVTGKVRRSKTSVLPLCNATNQSISYLELWAFIL